MRFDYYQFSDIVYFLPIYLIYSLSKTNYELHSSMFSEIDWLSMPVLGQGEANRFICCFKAKHMFFFVVLRLKI